MENRENDPLDVLLGLLAAEVTLQVSVVEALPALFDQPEPVVAAAAPRVEANLNRSADAELEARIMMHVVANEAEAILAKLPGDSAAVDAPSHRGRRVQCVPFRCRRPGVLDH